MRWAACAALCCFSICIAPPAVAQVKPVTVKPKSASARDSSGDSLRELSQAYRKLFRKLGPQVVGVRIYSTLKKSPDDESDDPKDSARSRTRVQSEISSLSGLVWSKDGLVVTIFSGGLPVIDDDDRDQVAPEAGDPIDRIAATFSIALHDGTVCDAELVGTDPRSGIGLLRIIDPPRSLKPVRPLLTTPELGSLVFTLGSGVSLHSGLIKSTNYRVRGRNGQFSFPRAIGTSVDALPGDVGGLLSDEQGRMLGLLAFESRDSQGFDAIPKGDRVPGRWGVQRGGVSRRGGWRPVGGVGGLGGGGAASSRSVVLPGRALAIPSDLVVKIVEQLRRNGKVVRGRIGASFTAIGAEKLSLSMKRRVFAQVVWLDPKGPAAAAGLQENDAILQIDDRLLRTTDDLFWFAERVEFGQVGRVLNIQYLRPRPGQSGPGPIRVAKIIIGGESSAPDQSPTLRAPVIVPPVPGQIAVPR